MPPEQKGRYKMIYDYNQYNSPEKGNKHIYAYGEPWDSIEYIGFIYADTKAQAKTVLNAHNRAWDDYNVLLNFSEDEIRAEYARREKEYKQK